MTLGDLMAGLAPVDAAWASVSIAGVASDSRRVQPGMVFVALPYMDRAGFRFDGHDFVAAAVAAGASAVVANRPLPEPGVPVVVVPDTRYLLSRLAGRLYGQPSDELTLVACTGTNGKTTSTYLLEAIWAELGLPCAVVGTVETRLGAERRPAATTTPDPVTLWALWRECVDRGIGQAVMEVSSHAIHQHRVGGMKFDAALFCNLTQDHLDYHVDMEEYFEAKASLFAADEDGHQPIAVINGDDAYGQRLLARDLRSPLSFGFGAGHAIRALAPVYSSRGTGFDVVTPAGSWHQTLLTLGDYNVMNALGVIGLALALKLPVEAIRSGLAGTHGAPGRLEQVLAGQPYAILVDYAHSPDGVAKATAAMRGLTEGRLITVFGCGGDRDRGKRPQMGRLAAETSDITVVTSDNPRTEDPQAIVNDILAGIDAESTELHIEVDRHAAIGLALSLARAGDVVLILGKGHEDYQIVGTEKHHFDDRETAREWVGRLAQ